MDKDTKQDSMNEDVIPENRKPRGADDAEINIGKELWSFFRDLIISLLVVLCIFNFVIRPIQVKGSSMYGTLEDGYFGVSDLLGYRLFGLKRFDIVIVYLEEKDEYIIKRVIGMPGETVSYQAGKLYINGSYTEEPFLETEYVESYRDVFMQDVQDVKLGDNEYFCLGDNRPHSSDSRVYGAFNKDQIISKGIFVLFPLSGFGVHTW